MFLCVGDRLGLTLAGKNASTNGLADTNAETASYGNDEGSEEDLEPQSLLLAHAGPPGVDAATTTGSCCSALGSLGLILVTKSLLGRPHCAFFGTGIEARS